MCNTASSIVNLYITANIAWLKWASTLKNIGADHDAVIAKHGWFMRGEGGECPTICLIGTLFNINFPNSGAICEHPGRTRLISSCSPGKQAFNHVLQMEFTKWSTCY